MPGRITTGNRTRTLALLVGGLALAAGCGGSSTKAVVAANPSPSAPSAASGTVVMVRSGPLGSYLTDSSGRTLYEFASDKGHTSACYGTCAQYWPPLTTTGPPSASGQAESAQLGTTPRQGGALQVTYAGHPLYRYAPDAAAGDTRGQGSDSSGGLWWMLAPSGSLITSTAPVTPATQSPAGGSSGYNY
jgi:predicted lipoprotein with Yx(FWY)xxD motif